MSDTTHIQWTDATWNTVTGCTRVSEGCERCYIDRTPPFRMAHRLFDSPAIGGTTGVILHQDRLTLPLRWRKPRRVFVNSLSDLLHESVPTEHIAKVWAVMAASPQHTYQILTKRPARLRSLLHSDAFVGLVRNGYCGGFAWPLPNVWLGVSVESQKWADIRIPTLLDTPAAVRWISAEPLLGPVRLSAAWVDMPVDARPVKVADIVGIGLPNRLDWVVTGGESGPGARPMDLNWAMDLVIQCSAATVPMFVKQLGSVWARENGAADRKGGDPAEWPVGLQERQFPTAREAVAVR